MANLRIGHCRSFVFLFFFLLLTTAQLTTAASKSSDGLPSHIKITFDDTAVVQLLNLMATHDSSDASLEAWLDLPANRYVLQVGASEENLTRDRLKANALAVIKGMATEQSQPFMDIGSLRMSVPQDYRLMLQSLRATEAARIATITARDLAFCPPGMDISETVYLHMGGDWDAINTNGAIYVNMRFWHDRVRPSWDGLNMIIAHETMHTIQNTAYGNPQDQTASDGAFLTGLSKIQREGTARYVEVDADAQSYTEYTYGFINRATDAERLRDFPKNLSLLQKFYDACYPTFDHQRFVDAFSTGIENGGPYYDIGHGIAKAIDERLGRKALIETIQRGPKDFFRKYVRLTAIDPTLPKLPLGVAMQTAEMPDKL